MMRILLSALFLAAVARFLLGSRLERSSNPDTRMSSVIPYTGFLVFGGVDVALLVGWGVYRLFVGN